MSWTPAPESVAASTVRKPIGGLLVGGVLALYSILIGNPLSARAIASAFSRTRGSSNIPVITFLKWSYPRSGNSRPGRGLLADAYWPDLNGPVALRTLSLQGERHQHWIASNLRTLAMIVIAAALVHLVLKSLQSGGLLVRWMAVTGSLAVAGATSSMLGTLFFIVAKGRTSYPSYVDSFIGTVGLGATFGLLIGIPLALVVAMVEGNRQR
jgi:hypothetical protein